MAPEQVTRRGRPRSADSRAAVLDAAFAMLREQGFAAMTVEAVASASGVARTTIYRGWSTRQDLAVDAFFTHTKHQLVFPDTGSAQEDFRQQIQQLAQLLRGQVGGAMAAMIGASRHDPVLRQALGTRWVMPRRQWGQARMDRAIADGECVDGLDRDAALEVLYGPIYARMLFGFGVPSAAEVDAALCIAFRGIFR